MWIPRKTVEQFQDELKELRAGLAESMHERRVAEAVSNRLEVENARLRSDLDWFKLRLNAVEKERQMLILDRIGVKIPVPEFVTAQNMPEELDAMNAMPDMSMIGDDAPAGFNPAKEIGPDYTGLPVRANN